MILQDHFSSGSGILLSRKRIAGSRSPENSDSEEGSPEGNTFTRICGNRLEISMTNTLTRKETITGLLFAALFISILIPSFAFADSRGRGVQSAGENRRTETLTRVLAILEENVPEQAESPEAVAEALANEPGTNSSSGNNGGTTAGNGGNGGNSSPGGLVKAGNVVSNSTAINAINTVIVRISLR